VGYLFDPLAPGKVVGLEEVPAFSKCSRLQQRGADNRYTERPHCLQSPLDATVIMNGGKRPYMRGFSLEEMLRISGELAIGIPKTFFAETRRAFQAYDSMYKILNEGRRGMKKKDLVVEISELERRVRVLECPHKHVKFVPPFFFGFGRKQCVDCGKTLKTYSSHEAFLVDKLTYLQGINSSKIAGIKAELKKLRARKAT